MRKVDVDMSMVRNKNGITTSDVDLLEYDVFWKFIAATGSIYMCSGCMPSVQVRDEQGWMTHY